MTTYDNGHIETAEWSLPPREFIEDLSVPPNIILGGAAD